MNSNNSTFLTTWSYSKTEWNSYVAIEKANKKEDNIFFGIGIIIVGVFGLMVIRGTTIFTAFCFAVPLAILIPFLRMKFSYPYLRNTNSNATTVNIFENHLQINTKKTVIYSKHRRLKSIKIIDAKNSKLLEFTIEWSTRKGPTNDEFRVLIPTNKMLEAKQIVNHFRGFKDDKPEVTFGHVLKTTMR